MGLIFAEKAFYGSGAAITNRRNRAEHQDRHNRDVNRLLRFYLRGSPFVSGPRSLKE